MHRLSKSTISLMLVAAAWGGAARADSQPADSRPVEGAADVSAEPSAANSADASQIPALSSADEAALRKMAQEQEESEVIEVWAERPDKPFDRDTKLRLTGEELAARGVTDLGMALAMLTDVQVREAGRGGSNIDIRGARKGSVRILIDGISVSDPYYGTFDVSTIPITDIEQIRVSTSPSSPIDGPGGPGGVVEVHTRDAIGAQLVRARVTTDTGPTFGVSGSARASLSPHSALRLSASGTAGARDFDLPAESAMASLGESRRSASGASRLEVRHGNRRVALDASFDDRHYIQPPSDEYLSAILLIDRETTMRSLLSYDDKVGKLQVQARAWADRMRRESRYFRDATFTEQTSDEDLRALRVGGQLLVTRPITRDLRWAASATADRDSADVVSAANGVARQAVGDQILSELAGDLQYEGHGLLLDGAVGVAIPVGLDADPWFEAKLDARYQPTPGIEIAAIAAQKGRAPSLRERFDPNGGNEALDPELARHAELRLTAERHGVRVVAAPFVRRSTGTVRLDPKLGRQINIGQLDVRGVDSELEVAVTEVASVGGGYSWITATSDNLGDDPLDRLPEHRYDLFAKVSPSPRLSAQAHLRYIGRRRDQGAMLGAYTTVEANLTSQITDEYLAVLRVEDAMDKQPEIRNGYHASGRLYTLLLQGTWQ